MNYSNYSLIHELVNLDIHMLGTHKIFMLLLSKCENRILRGEIPYISR